MRMGINTACRGWRHRPGSAHGLHGVGETTNLAARLLGLAKPGQIVVSRRAQQLECRVFRLRRSRRVPGQGEAGAGARLRREQRDQRPDQAGGVAGARPDAAGRPRAELGALAGSTAGRRRPGRHRAARGRCGGWQIPAAVRVLAPHRGGGRPRAGDDLASDGGSMAFRPIVELLRRYLGLVEGKQWRGDPAAASPSEMGVPGPGGRGAGASSLAHFLGVVPARRSFSTAFSSSQ